MAAKGDALADALVGAPPGVLAGASGATRLLYDGQAVIAEYGSSGQVMRRYVHGPAVDEPLVWYEGSGAGTRYGLTADRLGSVTAVTNDSGAAAAINTYDEYGIPGANNAGRFQYTGQSYVSEFGVYNYKARNYSPTLGRFMQTDPIGYGDGMNMYGYVHGDPVNGTDPTGTLRVIEELEATRSHVDTTLEFFNSLSPFQAAALAIDVPMPGIPIPGGDFAGLLGQTLASAVQHAAVALASMASQFANHAVNDFNTQFVIRGGIASPDQLI